MLAGNKELYFLLAGGSIGDYPLTLSPKFVVWSDFFRSGDVMAVKNY